jgi:phage replication O-like protein O
VSEIKVDTYVLDVLMRDLTGHERKASAFLVYLCLWARTVGTNRRMVRLSHRQLAEATGLSKSAVQSAVKLLARRKLLRAQRETRTSAPSYTLYQPWSRRNPPR